jgi:hypothetical protein
MLKRYAELKKEKPTEKNVVSTNVHPVLRRDLRKITPPPEFESNEFECNDSSDNDQEISSSDSVSDNVSEHTAEDDVSESASDDTVDSGKELRTDIHTEYINSQIDMYLQKRNQMY